MQKMSEANEARMAPAAAASEDGRCTRDAFEQANDLTVVEDRRRGANLHTTAASWINHEPAESAPGSRTA